MKIKLTKREVQPLITEAEEGSGREVEIGGENFQVDITILPSDIMGHPELNGGTLRVILNKRHKYIGHTAIAPKAVTCPQGTERRYGGACLPFED